MGILQVTTLMTENADHSEQGNNIRHVAIYSDQLHHSEYDIESLDNGDNALIKDAHKLIVNPIDVEDINIIQFRKNKNSLLTIPIENIEKVISGSNADVNYTKQEAESLIIQITFSDSQQSKKSIFFKVKNKKYVDEIQRQIQLIKDFEKEYGEILLQTDTATYNGGHINHIISGILGKHQSGSLYLSDRYLIFVKEDKDISKRWEIVIPLKSVILDWSIEEKERQEWIEWEDTNTNNFGFGSGFIHDSGKNNDLVVPYVDENGISQEPRFGFSFTREWAAELYKRIIKVKSDHATTNILEEISHKNANCFSCGLLFEIYNLIICDHCMTAFCTMENHQTEPVAKFDSKYLGWHRLYPNAYSVKVFVFSDRIEILDMRIEIANLKLRIPYNSIDNVGNLVKNKPFAFGTGAVGLAFMAGSLLKKNRTYTTIEYTDAFDIKQTLIFDFGHRLSQAQQMIYNGMIAFRAKKKQILELQKIADNMKDQKLPIKKITADNAFQHVTGQKPESEANPIETNTMETRENGTATTPYKPNEISNSADNPLHILKVRLAKGEISKEEYEEMRRMVQF